MKKQSKPVTKPKKSIPAAAPAIKKPATLFAKENLLLIVIVFISYGASLINDYALDDFIVFVQNRFVQSGVAGIGNIFGKDTFAGMTDANVMVLAGGRYRPLSVVTFAIEHQLFGNTALISHLINVLLYAITGIVLLQLLKQYVIKNDALSLIITILFIALPIHSESVINVKGRDDILCLLFFILSLQSLFNFEHKKKLATLCFSLLFFFLSLLSKETAITFVVIIPLSLYFFTPANLPKNIKTSLPYVFVALLFIAFRYLATKNNNGTISKDLFNDPFVMMTVTQRYATILLTWLLYLKLIFLPIHLSYDYNYNQIPATGFSDWRVILSIIIHVSMIIVAVGYFKRKSLYSYGILFYFIAFSIVSNLFFNIGAPMAERFMFIPSLGICIAAGKLFYDLYIYFSKSLSQKLLINAGYSFFGLLIIAATYRNITRCSDWKNNHALFIADVKSVPNNAKANLNAGLAFLEIGYELTANERQQNFDSAKAYYLKAIDIYPSYPDGYLNTGVIYSWEENFDSAEIWWNRARQVDAGNNKLKDYDKVLSAHYYQSGLKEGVEKNYEASIKYMLHAYQYDSLNAEITYNLGGAYFTINDLPNAQLYFNKTLALNSGHQQSVAALQVINQRMKGIN